MDKIVYIDYETKICASALNTISDTVWDALGQAQTPVQARQFIGAVEEAPNDGGLYLRSNLAWVSSSTYVNKAGDTMTGPLYLKHPVGASIGIGWKGTDNTTVGSFYRDLANGSYHLDMRNNAGTPNGMVRFDLSGYIEVNGAQPPVGGSLTRKDYVDGQVAGRVSLGGDTMTGNLVVPSIQSNGEVNTFGNVAHYNAATRNSAQMFYAGAVGTAVVAQLYRNGATGSYTFELSDNTGVGTKTFYLSLDGEAYKAVAGPWAGISDARKKNVLGEYSDGLAAVLSVRPVRYELKDSPERQHVGILAQDLLETPLGADCITEDSEGFYQYNGNALTYALVNAVKELSAKLDSAMAEIAALKANK